MTSSELNAGWNKAWGASESDDIKNDQRRGNMKHGFVVKKKTVGTTHPQVTLMLTQ